MARGRIRTVKPEFWVDETNLEQSDSCALFFIGLWNFCDDEGKHPLHLNQIVAELGGRWHKGKVKLFLSCLIKSGQLRLNSDTTWIQVTGWSHQKIDKPKQPDVKSSELQWLSKIDSTKALDNSRVFNARIGSDSIGKEEEEKAPNPPPPLADLKAENPEPEPNKIETKPNKIEPPKSGSEPPPSCPSGGTPPSEPSLSASPNLPETLDRPSIDPPPTVIGSSPPLHPLMEIWNEHCGEHLRPVIETDAKRTVEVEKKWLERSQEYWIDTVKKISESHYLTGQKERYFLATFDWMLNPVRRRKLHEGEYTDQTKSKVSRGASEILAKINVAVRRFGRYEGTNAKEFIGERGWEAVCRAGGWAAVCETPPKLFDTRLEAACH